MKKMIKRLVFALIIVSLVLATGVVIKTGKFAKLEGYMYSFAAEITNSATDCNATSSNAQDCATSSNATSSNATSSNATSSNAQDCATSSNATSSNAQQCATSSNATSSNAQQCATSSNATSSNATDCNATSSNATSSNAQTTETIKVTNTQTNTKPSTPTITEPEESEEEVKTDLTYNNSEITQDILAKISNSTETQSITINLDNNVNISEDIFETIKGKEIKLTINVGENQIIFNGNDITTPKDINAEISYNLASEDTLLKEIVEEGVVINFANNGKLPGTATIRIKVTDEMKKALNMETILVYHYDEETKELSQMTSNATYKEDGFIEFSIDHNSKYLFVNELIEEKEYTVTTGENTEVKNEVSFLESHKMYIIILGVSVLAIIIVVIILIVDKKVKAKEKLNVNQDKEKLD